MGYACHGYDAVVVVLFVVVEIVHVGVYKWQCSPHSCDIEWLKVGVVSRSIFGVAVRDKLLLDRWKRLVLSKYPS